ncbi:MAG: hypothetical protein Q8Q11_01435 [bacterium]|nr:hypothetical protein [bacterium]MDZ4248068.1 hypothetical protein [Patescibacteria group bacterium]
MSVLSAVIGSVFLTAAGLIFTAIKRRTGLPLNGVIELSLVRITNVIANVTATFMAGLMFGVTIVGLFLITPAVWVLVGIIALYQGGFGFLTDIQLVKQVLFTVFSSSVVVCYWYLAATLLEKEQDPPFSVLTFDRDKFPGSTPL